MTSGAGCQLHCRPAAGLHTLPWPPHPLPRPNRLLSPRSRDHWCGGREPHHLLRGALQRCGVRLTAHAPLRDGHDSPACCCCSQPSSLPRAATTAVYTCKLLLDGAVATGAADFEQLAFAVGGFWMRLWSEVWIVVLLFGTNMGGWAQDPLLWRAVALVGPAVIAVREPEPQARASPRAPRRPLQAPSSRWARRLATPS